jgi:hypothetical protein
MFAIANKLGSSIIPTADALFLANAIIIARGVEE